MASTKTDVTKSTSTVAIAGAPDASNWEKEQTGFDPYWNPGEKKIFFGRVVSYDDTDPDFIRYKIRCEQDTLECKQGAKEEAVDIVVQKGDTFTVSSYKQLDNKFQEYLESGINPVFKCEAVKEVKTKTVGQTCWIYDLRVSPTDMKLLKTFRAEKEMILATGRAERRAMQENASA
jgi:hypothetical protein